MSQPQKPVIVPRITADAIQRAVVLYFQARGYDLTRADILGPFKPSKIAWPRQIAMYLAKRYTPLSLPQIARRFQRGDHTTPRHAALKVQALLDQGDEDTVQIIRDLCSILQVPSMIVLDLPMPPTTNNLFPTNPRTGKRYRSPQYKAWIENAGKVLNTLKPGRLGGRVAIDIAVSEKARGDVANREKATVDLLVAHGVIDGDQKKYTRSVKTHWDATLAEGVRVTITPAEGT